MAKVIGQRAPRRLTWVTAAALSLACWGCTGGPFRTVAQSPAPEPAGGAIALGRQGEVRAVPYAPAGTEFEVRLDRTIDTQTSVDGEPFTATLIRPISAGGVVLVPQGAELHGRVARIDRFGPRIELAFDSVALPAGRAPIGARVISVELTRYRTLPPRWGVANAQPPSLGSPEERAMGIPEARVGGPDAQVPGPDAQDRGATIEMSIPQGAALRLILTRPIVDARSL
jgi:hypothetical protein